MRLPQYLIQEANQVCDEPMYNCQPEIELSQTKDELANTANGFLFGQHAENKLSEACLDLQRVCTT